VVFVSAQPYLLAVDSTDSRTI